MLNACNFATLKNLCGKFFENIREGGIRTAIARVKQYILREILLQMSISCLHLCTLFKSLPAHTCGPKRFAQAKHMLRANLDIVVGIKGQYFCLYGDNLDFSNTTNVVVAHWDPQNVVDPYVEKQCRHFKSLGWRVILASAATLQSDAILERWHEWADAIVCRSCAGYDFTSWKAALDCFPSLYKSHSLILTNDSYFGPIGSFAPVHDSMAKVKCDFWGMTENNDTVPHLQSYYLVFYKKTLQHAALKIFFDAVKLSGCRKDAISYEMSLTLWLVMHGLRPGVYCSLPATARFALNPTLHFWKALIEKGVPLIKREKFRPGKDNPHPEGWNKILLQSNYSPMIIAKYFWRIGKDISGTQTIGKVSDEDKQNIFAIQQTVDLRTVHPKNKIYIFAVFLHAFYVDTLQEMLEYLQNIPTYAHVFVSTDSKEKKERIFAVLAPLGFKKLDIRVMPNVGWDIAPFVAGWGDTINQYPLILKIHAKKSNNQPKEYGSDWRELICSSLFGSQDRINKILQYFDEHSELGLIAPVTHPAICGVEIGKCYRHMKKFLRYRGLEVQRNTAVDFPVGSMFWARPAILRHWLSFNLTFEDFERLGGGHRDGSLAHAMERLFVWGCLLEHMTWGRVAPIGYDSLERYQ